MENIEATEKGFDEDLCFIDFMKLSKNLQISKKAEKSKTTCFYSAPYFT